jgi:hypothetical protein
MRVERVRIGQDGNVRVRVSGSGGLLMFSKCVSMVYIPLIFPLMMENCASSWIMHSENQLSVTASFLVIAASQQITRRFIVIKPPSVLTSYHMSRHITGLKHLPSPFSSWRDCRGSLFF